ncbi:hypothetical protein SAZ11_57475 [Streptomyces sp. FXJ1.4098]|nr:hypothetical protein [Streptomyces sp. FXJ1.4098]
MYCAGHREARAMSSTLLRSVSSPRPSTIALAVAGSTRASVVATALRASSMSVTWMISGAPALRTRSTNGLGSPKDSITAIGLCSSVRAITPSSIAHVWKPMPQGFPAHSSTRTGSSRASQS